MDIKYEFRKIRDRLLLFLARKMPKRLALWVFVVVSGADGKCPDPSYSTVYKSWVDKHNLEGM